MAVPNMIVTLLANTTKFNSGMKQAGGTLTTFGSIMGKVGGFVAGALGALGLAVLNVIPDLVRLAVEAKVADERLRFMANNMLGLSKQTDKTVQHLKDYATTLQESTGIDDEFIKGIQGKLLSFKVLSKSAGVAGGMFDRLTQLTLDMSVVFGDAEGNAVKLGRVMLDPIKNMNTLTRASGGFTQAEKDKAIAIEATNGQMAASDYLIGVLEDKFGGLAEATADPLARITKQFEDIGQAVAEKAMPAIEILADKIVEWVKGPKGKKAIQDMTDAFTKFFEYITSPKGQKAMDDLIDSFKTIARFIADIILGIGEIAKFLDGNYQVSPGSRFYNPSAGGGGGRVSSGGNSSAPGGRRPSGGGSGPGGPSSAPIINFNSPIDSVSAGREISRVLNDYHRSNGGKR